MKVIQNSQYKSYISKFPFYYYYTIINSTKSLIMIYNQPFQNLITANRKKLMKLKYSNTQGRLLDINISYKEAIMLKAVKWN